MEPARSPEAGTVQRKVPGEGSGVRTHGPPVPPKVGGPQSTAAPMAEVPRGDLVAWPLGKLDVTLGCLKEWSLKNEVTGKAGGLPVEREAWPSEL